MAVRKAKWQNDYIDKTYDRINLTVPKGNKEVIKEAAARCGESVNGFINRLIDAEIGRLRCMKYMEGGGSGFSCQEDILYPDKLPDLNTKK